MNNFYSKILLALLILISFINANAQEKYIKKSIYVLGYGYKSKNFKNILKKKKQLISYSIYDENNILLEETEYGEPYKTINHSKTNDGSVKVSIYLNYNPKNLNTKILYKYDNGNMISQKILNYRNNKIAYEKKEIYLYDSINKCIGYVDEENDTTYYKIQKKDTLVSIKNVKYLVNEKDTVYYNFIGNPILKIEYNKNGKDKETSFYYDSNNHLIKEVINNFKTNKTDIINYTFNQNGLLISKIRDDKTAFKNKIYYKYKRSNLKKIIYYDFNKKVYEERFKYKKINFIQLDVKNLNKFI